MTTWIVSHPDVAIGVVMAVIFWGGLAVLVCSTKRSDRIYLRAKEVQREEEAAEIDRLRATVDLSCRRDPVLGRDVYREERISVLQAIQGGRAR